MGFGTQLMNPDAAYQWRVRGGGRPIQRQAGYGLENQPYVSRHLQSFSPAAYMLGMNGRPGTVIDNAVLGNGVDGAGQIPPGMSADEWNTRWSELQSQMRGITPENSYLINPLTGRPIEYNFMMPGNPYNPYNQTIRRRMELLGPDIRKIFPGETSPIPQKEQQKRREQITKEIARGSRPTKRWI